VTGPSATGPLAKGPLVSIVLPVYNGRRYLRDSINSCLRQTYENWELIVVDDASIDETPVIIAEFVASDDRIRAIRHEGNRKLPAALNTGFADSRGEYLTWTSDDNMYEPEAIELMVDSLQANPHVGMVFCDHQEIDAEGAVVRIRRPYGPKDFPYCVWIGPCFMYRREVYEKIGDYDPDIVLAEDHEYWLRVLSHFEVLHFPEATPYKYRLHPNNLTETRRFHVEMQMARAIARYIPSRPERRRYLAAAACGLAWRARQQGCYRKALQCYLAGLVEGGAYHVAVLGMIKLLPHWLFTTMRKSRLGKGLVEAEGP